MKTAPKPLLLTAIVVTKAVLKFGTYPDCRAEKRSKKGGL
jgi:hypothetical protein